MATNNLLPEDIDDLKAALAVLTREELETYCIDRSIRADATCGILTPEQEEQYFQNLSETPLSEEEFDEMNRVMEIVKSQIELG